MADPRSVGAIGGADLPASRSERVVPALRALERLGPARLRLSLARPEGEAVLFDGIGSPARDDAGLAGAVVEERWPVGEGLEARLAVAPGGDDRTGADLAEVAALVRETIAPLLVSEAEIGFFTRELAGRFEEVELLTSLGETLGSMLGIDRAAARLLAETARVLGAEEAEVWLSDPAGPALRRFAAFGGPEAAGPDRGWTVHDAASDPSPLARCFRERAPESGFDRRPGGRGTPWLVVPLRHTALHGTAGVVGVLKLRGERGGPPFRTRELRLASAVASHLAATFENRRLLDESVERERMLVELELAHDLQLKLLPEPASFRDLADVAARCDPAESVGGDFYHLLRLPGGRLGVMLGDVSSHGYSAGLIMALTMSAASLVGREEEDPARALAGIHHELVRRLESTEMYMTLCYVVLDPGGRTLRYANAGHPHAWRIGDDGTVRLEALNPPLGIAEFDTYGSREMPWRPGSDTLLLFTDGLSECLRTERLWSDELLTAVARDGSDESAGRILERLFGLACEPGDLSADDRTAVVVK
ncbi:MAG: SpoIIE family protein phosphatase [Gemmatimonadota bacterium]